MGTCAGANMVLVGDQRRANYGYISVCVIPFWNQESGQDSRFALQCGGVASPPLPIVE